MSFDLSTSSISPILSPNILSGGAGDLNGATSPQKLHAACQAIEGLFAGQLLSEIGKGVDGAKDSGQYQDFIQQALAQQVTSGGGFGLASMLEKSLTPAHAHLTGAAALHLPTPLNLNHGNGNAS